MKIVIVDDEYFVRMGISSVVKQIPGMSVVGEAENGEEALKVILATQPDLVFLDITMPAKDGLSVLEELRRQGFKQQVVMLTSHDDFQLARKALRLGASDYVLKNELVGDKMLAYLKDVKTQSQGIAQVVPTSEPAQQTEQPQASLYKERFLQTLLRVGGIGPADFEKARVDYHLNLSTTNFYIILMQLENWHQVMAEYSENSLQNVFQKIAQYTQEQFGAPYEYESFYNRQNQYTLLIANPHESSSLAFENELKARLTIFAKQAETLLESPVKVAVYRNPYSILEINKAYAHTHELLAQEFFFPKQQFFWEGTLNEYAQSDLSQLTQQLAELPNSGGSLAGIIRTFLKENQHHLINQRDFFSMLIPKLRALTKESPLQSQIDVEDFENIDSLLKSIDALETEIKAFDQTKQYSYIVRQAIALIQSEFQKHLSLEEVAQELGVSSSYFSRLFSSEMGIPFSQYLTQRRVEHAKKLLQTTNLKLYEISEMSGFSSPVYFNNNFKKIVKMTPKQYRDMGEETDIQ